MRRQTLTGGARRWPGANDGCGVPARPLPERARADQILSSSAVLSPPRHPIELRLIAENRERHRDGDCNLATRNSSSGLVVLLFPAAMILLAYNYLFHWPQQRELKSVRDEVARLEAKPVSLADLTSERMRQQQLNRELKAIQEEAGQLQGAFARFAEEQLGADPTRVVSSLTELFARHQLLVESHESHTGAVPRGVGQLHKLLRERAPEVAAEASSGEAAAGVRGGRGSGARGDGARARSTTGQGPQQYRMTLLGRFVDLQAALQELAELPLAAIPLEIAMQPASFNTKIRTWVITFAI